MEIRRAIADDIVELIQLMQYLGTEPDKSLRRSVRYVNESSDRLILVSDNGSQLVGFLGMKKFDDDKRARKIIDLDNYCCLSFIGVHPDYRNQRQGSQLILACDSVCRDFGKKGIWLDCREKRVRLYHYNGYEVVGSYDDLGKPRFVMAKELV